MIVAIDGPAGSGKSTVAKAMATREHLTYLDTGAMYRSVTLACMRRGCDLASDDEVVSIAKRCDISFTDGGTKVLLDGEDVSADIRTAEVDACVSRVSSISEVRRLMVATQRRLASNGDVVAEGRDIGTVVFPEAEVKVFLVADPEARAHRRAVQRDGGDEATGKAGNVDAAEEKAVLDDLRRRDELDSTRKTSPLVAADDAVRIDSTSLSVDQVCDRIHDLIEAARAKGESEPETKPDHKEEGDVRSETKPAKVASRRDAKAAPKPMRAFHNVRDDYFDHGMREFPWPSRAIFNIAAAIVWALSKIWWRWSFENEDEFIEHVKGHGSVIVMNHVSMVEPVVTVVMMWAHGIRVRAIYKTEFDSNALTRWVFSRVGGIPVDRGSADLKAIRRAQRALERGECVLIYPEGTRIKSDDEEVEMHGGFSLMAQLARTDVVPMAVVGARDVTPKGHHFPRPLRVFLSIGRPISFEQLGVKGRKASLAAMEEKAMHDVFELRDALRREHPGKE